MQFAPDGKSFAATSSLDGTGAVNFYNYDFDTEMPADILAIENKAGRTEEEKKKEEDHFTSNVKLLASVPFNAGIYALSYQPDGKAVAVAGEDGKVRMINPCGCQGPQGIRARAHRRRAAHHANRQARLQVILSQSMKSVVRFASLFALGAVSVWANALTLKWPRRLPRRHCLPVRK